jgi:hypothetical protein
MLESVLSFLDALGAALSVFCLATFFLCVVAGLVDWACTTFIGKGPGDE